jgi:hypothetical protein
VICDICSSDLPEGALFCGECGSSVTSRSVNAPAEDGLSARARDEAADTEVLPQFLNETPILAAMLSAKSDAASDASADGETGPELPRYVFTLSTGESLEISANGLLGRMPQPAEGEAFAHLIIVTDTTRSVSKTHLEFGFDGEQLWILDRNSGNGSIIRETGKIPRRAEPWRQYAVGRGTRVDMGDAHLLIS